MTDFEIIDELSSILDSYLEDFSEEVWYNDFDVRYIIEANMAISLSIDSVGLIASGFNDINSVVYYINRLKSLQSLSLSGLPIIEDDLLMNLTNLEQLESLEVYIDFIENLPTNRLVNLKKLNLSIFTPSNPNLDIIDLSPIAELVNLEELTIFTSCHDTFLSPLKTLPNLRKLDIEFEDIKDIESLIEFSHLEELTVNYWKEKPEEYFEVFILAHLPNLKLKTQTIRKL
jgi:Leucine-rich repeat (LRR) protein